jgi:hypothetical protein
LKRCCDEIMVAVRGGHGSNNIMREEPALCRRSRSPMDTCHSLLPLR